MALTIEQSNKATSYDSYSGTSVSDLDLAKLGTAAASATGSKTEVETVDLSSEVAKTVSYTAGTTLGSAASKITYGYNNAQSAKAQKYKVNLRSISSTSKIYRFIVYDRNGKQIVFDSSSKETLDSLVKKYGAKNVVADIRTATNAPLFYLDAKTLQSIESKAAADEATKIVPAVSATAVTATPESADEATPTSIAATISDTPASKDGLEDSTAAKADGKASSTIIEELADSAVETLTGKSILETGIKTITKTETVDNSTTALKNGGVITTKGLTKIKINGKYTTLQGCTETDKYYVCFAINKDTESESTSMIVIDKKTNATVLSTVIKPGLEHANGVTYDENTDTIYVADAGGKNTTITSFNLSKAIKNKKVTFKETKISNGAGDCQVGGIAIDSSTGVTYLASGDHVYMVNANGTYTRILKASTGKTQDVYAKDGYLYVVRDLKDGANKTKDLSKATNSIDIYKDGKYIETKIVTSPKDSYELESLSYNSKTKKFTFYYNDIGNTNCNAICTVDASALKTVTEK